MLKLCEICGQEETATIVLGRRGEQDICSACQAMDRRYNPETGLMIEWREDQHGGYWVDITRTFVAPRCR